MHRFGVALSLVALGCGSAPQLELDANLSEAELEDIEAIAAQNGWLFNEAMERIGWQSRFVALAERLQEALPGQFAGAAITDEGEHQAYIAFKDGVPNGLDEAQSLAGLSVALVGHRGFSEAELDTRAGELHRQLLAAGFVANTSYDIETGEVEVELATGPVRREFPQMNADAVIWARLPEAALAPGVSISLVDELPGQNFGYTLYGGGMFYYGCTSAVTVRAGSTRGMLTAGHCNNGGLLSNDKSSIVHFATFRGEHEGPWGDFQWHTTEDPVSFSSQFHYDSNRRREAHALGNVVAGMSVCYFGQTSGRGCDRVWKTNVYSGVAGRLAATLGHQLAPGDSGGPWYYGNTVYGVSRGYKSIAGYRDVFAQLKYVDEALGVNVVVNPPPPPPPPPSSCNPKQCYLSCGGGECTSGGRCVCW